MAVPPRGVTVQVGHGSAATGGLPAVAANIACLLRKRKILMRRAEKAKLARVNHVPLRSTP
jgi:hypothetical protein